VLGVDGEIVVERRRRWTPAEKTALLGEIEATGGRVSVVAQRHGISKSLLYNWRSASKAAALAARGAAAGSAGFIQLGVVANRSYEDPMLRLADGAAYPRDARLALAARAGVMEIDLPQGVRVRVDSAVDEMALQRVLSALHGLR
jgi:transposase